jgi:2-isopropylmalate synthase
MERSPLSYQHVDPLHVGNEKRILISELSGRQNIMDKIREVGVSMGEGIASERATAILNRVKKLESVGYTFEGAEASVHLMILHATRGYCPPFRILDYSAQVFDSNIDSASRILAKEERRLKHQQEEEESGATPRFSSMDPTGVKGPTARATIQVRTLNTQDEVSDNCAYTSVLHFIVYASFFLQIPN